MGIREGSIVFLVGQTGCGKTTVSRILKVQGFEIRSASRALAKVGQARGHKVNDRSSLSALGLDLRRRGELTQFHEELFLNWTGEASILVDGPRFVETFDYAKLLHPRPILIYLQCTEDIRQQRYEMTDGSLSWEEISALETERSVLEFAAIADFVINATSSNPDYLAAQIVHRLSIS